jgi:hypothetical protein
MALGVGDRVGELHPELLAAGDRPTFNCSHSPRPPDENSYVVLEKNDVLTRIVSLLCITNDQTRFLRLKYRDTNPAPPAPPPGVAVLTTELVSDPFYLHEYDVSLHPLLSCERTTPEALPPQIEMLAEFKRAQNELKASRIERYLDYCKRFEGDPRNWRSVKRHEESSPVPPPVQRSCTWTLVRREGELLATPALEEPLVDLVLPFETSERPGRRVATCAGSATPPRRPLAARDFLSFEHGHLVGYDSGEWGGGLYWHGRDGSVRQVITEEPVRWLLEYPSGVVAVTATEHLAFSSGTVLLLQQVGGVWRHEDLRLQVPPQTLLRESEESVLLASQEGLVRVHWGESDGKLRIVALHTARRPWQGITSMESADDGSLLIPMRHGVVRLRREADGYAEEWLVPYDSPEDKRP